MGLQEYFCYTVADVRLGIPLNFIDRVIRSVAVRPLPNPPKIIHGLIDFYGELLPVVNLRRRLDLPEKPVSPEQVFVVIRTKVRRLALVVDSAEGIIPLPEDDLVSSHQLDAGIQASGVYLTKSGILLIYDPEKFLTARDEIQLRMSIQSATEKQKEE